MSAAAAPAPTEKYEYQTTVETCAGYLIIILIGTLYGFSPMYKKKHLTAINNCVFNIFLPCLVVQALRTRDFLNLEEQQWNFILAFFVLRVFLLLFAFLLTAIKYMIYHCCIKSNSNTAAIQQNNSDNLDDLGNDNDNSNSFCFIILATCLDSISAWLGTSWISTIILGGPVLVALYGKKFLIYGVYAALSSFFFQLPLMVMFLEIQSVFSKSLPFIRNTRIDNEKKYLDISQQSALTSPISNTKSKSNLRKTKNQSAADDSQSLLKGAAKSNAKIVRKTNNTNNNDDEEDVQLEMERISSPEKNNVVVAESENEVESYPPHHIDSNNKDNNNIDHDDEDNDDTNMTAGKLCLRVIKKIFFAFVKNTVIWAIVIGFILSFIYSSDDNLDPKIDFPIWLNNGLKSTDSTKGLGICTTPVGVFVIGLFTSEQTVVWFKYILNRYYRYKSHSDSSPIKSAAAKNNNNNNNSNEDDNTTTCSTRDIKYGIAVFIELFFYLFIKFFIAPAVMLGIAKDMFDLKCNIGRSAVIIATVPTSLASFTLTKRFELSTQTVMAFNVIIGTILMLPFVLMWLDIMDTYEHFVC